MKKKIIALMVALTIVVSFNNGFMGHVMASDPLIGTIADGSILTSNNQSIGNLDEDSIFWVDEDDSGIMPCGVYLLDGTATIKNAGNGKITAAGSTSAKSSCALKVTVTVQKYSSSSGAWNYVTSWTATKASGTYLSTSKTLSVTKGYFYRVKAYHSAGGEAGYSTTDGIKIS